MEIHVPPNFPLKSPLITGFIQRCVDTENISFAAYQYCWNTVMPTITQYVRMTVAAKKHKGQTTTWPRSAVSGKRNAYFDKKF